MDMAIEFHMVAQVVIAFLLGALVGWEREQHGTEAGIRTFGAIAVGACVFGLISLHGVSHIPELNFEKVDPSRIASNVVVGVGFLGAGIIFRRQGERERITGLTTAATLWTTSAIGLAVAFRMYVIAVLVTLIVVFTLWLSKFSWWKLISGKKKVV